MEVEGCFHVQPAAVCYRSHVLSIIAHRSHYGPIGCASRRPAKNECTAWPNQQCKARAGVLSRLHFRAAVYTANEIQSPPSRRAQSARSQSCPFWLGATTSQDAEQQTKQMLAFTGTSRTCGASLAESPISPHQVAPSDVDANTDLLLAQPLCSYVLLPWGMLVPNT